MIPKDLFKKIRRIQITTNRMVNDVFAGQYHSVFKGSGMEFDEVREYQVGDDIRTIDWNVTARTGKAHVKKYVEEREMTVMLLVDASASSSFATVNQLKSKLAAEIAALLAFSAIRNNDRVGLIIFTDKIEKFLPPRKGVQNVLRVIREVLYYQPENHATDITQALEYLNKVTSRRTVSFLISDFFEEGDTVDAYQPITDKLKKALAIANKKHDLIAVTLNDPRESSLVDCGLMYLEDAETGKTLLVDTSDQITRDQYYQNARSRRHQRTRLFRSVGVDHIDIHTDKPYANEMIKFFLMRRRRKAI